MTAPTGETKRVLRIQDSPPQYAEVTAEYQRMFPHAPVVNLTYPSYEESKAGVKPLEVSVEDEVEPVEPVEENDDLSAGVDDTPDAAIDIGEVEQEDGHQLDNTPDEVSS